MSRYDEDLYENPFFVELERNNQDLFCRATSNRWLICIPKFSLVEKEKLSKRDFEDHILVPDPDHDARFTTVSKHQATIQDGHINLGTGFKDFKQVDILFEEVFYNNKDESYRVLCVGDFFNKDTQVSTTEDDAVWAKPPATYDECLWILWSRAGSNKTREHVDKALLAYCSAYQKHEGDSIANLADLVSSQITGAMQIILKDQNIRRSVTSNDVYMVNLKVAAEMYFMNATHKHLFSTITASVKADDAIVNKMTRNLTELRLHHLGVRREFEENLPAARKELSALNQFSTPLGRLLCMKRVMTALTKPLPKASQNEGLVMTTDDFLPLLIYLIIKSQINNWTANLMYMKYFQQAKVADGDILGFYLTTTEAALDYIKSGEIKVDASQASPQKVARPVGSSDQPEFIRQASGGISAKSKFFQYVQFGDEAAVTLMLKAPAKDNDDVLSQLCHPLCSCDKCADITAKSKLSAREVSSLSRDDMGRTALHIAAFNGQAGLIDILVKNGSLADASDYLGCTPLHLACQKGFQNIILLLVHFGSDIGAVDNEGNTPLHLCAKNGHEDCVKAILFLDILKSKLNVNAQNDMGDTPLHLAAKWGYEGIVKFLLETEADARTRNRKRQTPLSLAQNSAIKRMLQTAFDDPPPIIYRHPIPAKKPSKLSIKVNNKASTPKPTKPSSTTTPISASSSSAATTPAAAKTPLKPATPSSSSQHNQTADHPGTSAYNEKSPMGFEVVDVKPARPAKELIDNSSSKMMAPKTTQVTSLDKIDPRQVDKLFTAISNKDIELVKYYLGWIDSPDIEDEESPRAGAPGDLCHPLCQCSKCQPIQKKLLFNTSPQQISCSTSLHVNCCNKKRFAPLHIAVIENYDEAFRLFLRKGANVNQQTHRNITALHLACFHNSSKMVKMLVNRGADVNLEDQYGEIPLHLAAAKNNVEIVQILILHSSCINLANVDGNTPLHRAAGSHACETLQLLLENGANPNIPNKHRQLPYNVTKNKDIQELLLASQAQLQKKTAATQDLHDKPRHDSQSDQDKEKLAQLLPLHVEGRDPRMWQTLGESIRDFPATHGLKRSQTFDHSGPALDNPQLKLSLAIQHFDKEKSLKRLESQTFDHSEPDLDNPQLKLSLAIQHFNKEKSLKRRETIDKSLPYLKPFKHSLTIQHFDSGTLKHVDPVDKSSPMHIYSLGQSLGGYSNYLDTPVEGREMSFRGCDESDTQGKETKCDSEGSDSVGKEILEEKWEICEGEEVVSDGVTADVSGVDTCKDREDSEKDGQEFQKDSEEIHTNTCIEETTAGDNNKAVITAASKTDNIKCDTLDSDDHTDQFEAANQNSSSNADYGPSALECNTDECNTIETQAGMPDMGPNKTELDNQDSNNQDSEDINKGNAEISDNNDHSGQGDSIDVAEEQIGVTEKLSDRVKHGLGGGDQSFVSEVNPLLQENISKNL